MRILYIGHTAPESTSRHRADALSRLGHDVLVADPYAALSGRLHGRLLGVLHYRTGYRLLQVAACGWVDRLLQQYAGWPELIWVNSGELIGAAAASKLTQFCAPMVLYNNDDPTGKRDGHRFDSLLAALPAYDLCAVLREPNVREFRSHGARAVARVLMSFDEVLHRPFDRVEDIPVSFRSDVAFIGTWMRGEARDKFLLSLIDRGLNVAIWGARWQKSGSWSKLQTYWRGNALAGRNYVAAIQGAKVCLGLLSKGNRDLHTTRTMEIPYAGGLLCAERTTEHLSLYKENEEAVFWSTADECADKCFELLRDDDRRERIRSAGMLRVRSNKVGNQDICDYILKALGKCI